MFSAARSKGDPEDCLFVRQGGTVRHAQLTESCGAGRVKRDQGRSEGAAVALFVFGGRVWRRESPLTHITQRWTVMPREDRNAQGIHLETLAVSNVGAKKRTASKHEARRTDEKSGTPALHQKIIGRTVTITEAARGRRCGGVCRIRWRRRECWWRGGSNDRSGRLGTTGGGWLRGVE